MAGGGGGGRLKFFRSYFLARALVSKDKGCDWYFLDFRVRSKGRCYQSRTGVTVQV